MYDVYVREAQLGIPMLSTTLALVIGLPCSMDCKNMPRRRAS